MNVSSGTENVVVASRAMFQFFSSFARHLGHQPVNWYWILSASRKSHFCPYWPHVPYPLCGLNPASSSRHWHHYSRAHPVLSVAAAATTDLFNLAPIRATVAGRPQRGQENRMCTDEVEEKFQYLTVNQGASLYFSLDLYAFRNMTLKMRIVSI